MGRNSYHFTEKSTWINDPNGLIYYKGMNHMFYQHHPYSAKWGPMHWGHAVSRDLIHWEHMPIALCPDELGAIFSGSAVLDKDNTSGLFSDEGGLVAIFTHAGEDNQKQSIAYSLDDGQTWIKYSGNPVLSNPGIKDFRDPKVFWHKESNKWIMILACGREVRFYGSKNLLQWDYLSSFGEAEGAPGGILECPTLVDLPIRSEEETKWVLKFDVIGRDDNTPYRALYYIGNFDGQSFICQDKTTSGLLVDGGADFYAAQDWFIQSEEGKRTLWIAWMNNWKYAEATPTTPWRGAMTTPREVEFISDKGGLTLSQRPIKELEALRGEKYVLHIVLLMTAMITYLQT